MCSLDFRLFRSAGNIADTNEPGGWIPGAALHGMVHGGQQPIVGAHVYLYAANTTGYGNAAVSLLQSAGGTVSDGHGN